MEWIDGPNAAMVESITRRFRASYFDGSIDYKGGVFHMFNGQQVTLGADNVTSRREYSDAFVEKAIAQVYRKYRGNFLLASLQCPVPMMFRRGLLNQVYLPGHWDLSLSSLINNALFRLSDRLAGKVSPNAKSLFVTHDDGYSREYGCGISAGREQMQEQEQEQG